MSAVGCSEEKESSLVDVGEVGYLGGSGYDLVLFPFPVFTNTSSFYFLTSYINENSECKSKSLQYSKFKLLFFVTVSWSILITNASYSICICY